MPKTTLTAKERKTVGRRVKSLRRQGSIPANIFGKDVESVNIQIVEKDLADLLKQTGESGLVYLRIEGEKSNRPVMISEIRRDPVTSHVLHVGWHQVNLKEKVTSAIPIKLTGTAPADEQKLGILVQQLQEVEVEALPTDMPENVEVDVSTLAAVDGAIYVKDLKINARQKVLSDPEVIVVKIEPLAAEEVVEKPVEEAPAPIEGEAPAATEAGESTAAEPANSDQSP